MSEDFFVQNGYQDGRIQYGCNHQVESEWMTLSQIELVGVRVRVEWECFWVNLREDNKVSESKMAEFKMAAIIKLSQNEWVKFFCANGGNQSWQVWVSLRGQTKNGWIKDGQIQNGRIQDGCHHLVEVRMNEFESDWISLSQSKNGVRVFLSESERR